MKYYAGDIVEVLNLSTGQVEDIQSQTCKTNANLSHIIGMRYKVSRSSNIFNTLEKYELEGWNHGGHMAKWFFADQLELVHRPLTSRLVSLFKPHHK